MCQSSSWSKSRCGQRARADERHVALEDVHELRELVERVAAQEPPDRRHPRVTLDLEQRAARLVERLEVRLALVGVRVHRAELQARERLAADARAVGAIDHRAARGEAHEQRAHREQRREEQQQQQRDDDVERALDEVVEAVEDRRAQLEQRHRGARDELGALEQDLHRRRRHAHGHAALVAGVHELDGALLGEVRVGDDHFLDAVDVQDLGDVLDPAERAQPVVRPRRERDEADHLDRHVDLVAQRVGDVLDVAAGADEHGAAPVAGGAQHRARDHLVDPARRAEDDHGEEQRAVEDVVAVVVLAPLTRA